MSAASERASATPEGWARVKDLLARALEQPADSIDAWLRTQTDDPALRNEVRALLAAHRQSAGLEPPAPDPEQTDEPAAPDGQGDYRAHRAAAWGALPEQLGPYRILRELGHGGMGTVVLARQRLDDVEREVALKLIHPRYAGSDIEARFRIERRILARLDHPHIAGLLDAGTVDGQPFLAMEYVDGEALDAYCRRLRPDLEERLELFRQICDAVSFAHRNLVIHRDLKPANILVRERDGAPSVQLLDFGIAKLLDTEAGAEEGSTALTRTGARAMTPEYASPEQMRGETVTTASDVYSLGVVLYELITGERPHELRDTPLPEIARVVCEEPAAPPSRRLRERVSSSSRVPAALRRDLDAIVLMALRKDPVARYPTVAELSADLERLQQGLPVRARRGDRVDALLKFVRRHRLAVAVTLLSFVLLIGFSLTLARQVAATERALDLSEREASRAAASQAFLEETLGAADPVARQGAEWTVVDALDRARQRLDASFVDEPATGASVEHLLGRLYSNLGRYSEGEELLRSALGTRRELLATGDATAQADLVATLESLGLLLGRSGRAPEAAPLLEEALERARQIHEGPHPQIARLLDHLARVANAAGDPGRAAELERRSIEVLEAAPSTATADLVHALGSLASFERENSRLPEATAAIERAVALLDEPSGSAGAGGAGAPTSLRGELQMNRGELLEAQGRYEEAVAAYRDGLAHHRAVYGHAHHWVGQGLVRLGTALSRQGQHHEAEAPMREGVEVLRATLGPDHPDVVVSLNNLGFFLSARGAVEEATRVLEEVVAMQRRNLPDHPFLGIALRNLGFLDMRSGDPASARTKFEEALLIHRRHHGDDHPRTAHSRLALAWASGVLGDWPGAVAPMRDAVAVFEAAYDDGHPRLADGRSLLGLALLRTGERARAAELLRRALPILREVHGPEDHRVERTAAALAELGGDGGR